MDDKTRTELEAAAFRRLLDHLRTRTDVQNIDMMNLAGFCRNCLSNWMKEAADAKGVPMSKDQSREAIYGMPFEEWKAKYPEGSLGRAEGRIRKGKPQALIVQRYCPVLWMTGWMKSSGLDPRARLPVLVRQCRACCVKEGVIDVDRRR